MTFVQRFDSGDIRLPLMQRDYVWKPRKVTRLLDFLYRRWPIGSFYVWKTDGDHGKLAAKPLDGFYGFLLGGQQRLTSLSLAIQGDAEGELSQRGFFDLENETFYLRDDSSYLNVIERIIQTLKDHRRIAGSSQSDEYRSRLQRVATMLGRDAVYEVFTDDQEEHAFELFSRLNKGGTSLSTGDVAGARLASAATRKIVEPMRAVVNEREMKSFDVNFVFLLRALATVHRHSCRFSKLPNN